jgi:hypothetical protein
MIMFTAIDASRCQKGSVGSTNIYSKSANRGNHEQKRLVSSINYDLKEVPLAKVKERGGSYCSL